MVQLKKSLLLLSFFMLGFCHLQSEEIETLDLDVVAYEDFIKGKESAIKTLKVALYQKGIVGIRGVPGYREKHANFVERAREFFELPQEKKDLFAPDRSKGDMFLGYEWGKEKFQMPDGTWAIDDLKESYYADVPDREGNYWPADGKLQKAYVDLTMLMFETGKTFMTSIGLTGNEVQVEDVAPRGRILHYRKSTESLNGNPYWCGAHYDQCFITALTPGTYFVGGRRVLEPREAGLFVKAKNEDAYKKIIANDPNVMLFQVGEFGQLASNDAIRATKHRVHKAEGCVERYALALFFNLHGDTVIRSTSELTQDDRYEGNAGDPCSFGEWSKNTFERFLVKEETSKAS